MAEQSIVNPIINAPYDPPERHFEIGPHGPTGKILDGRRPSESFIPVPAPKKGRKGEQEGFDFDATGERREKNSLINDIRFEIDRWRARGFPGVTPYTRKLLEHWSARPPLRDDPVLFCQREAAETAIFLAEVAGRGGGADYRTRIDPENRIHNDRLPRIALKMATGTGKTVVMAMLIAWQPINKVYSSRDARFAKRFLVVTPGITIKHRLRVLLPPDEGNYYRERDLIPSDLWDALLQAQVVIANYHAFLLRDSKEIQGVAANTRKILTAGKKKDPFRETADQMVARVLRDLAGRGAGEIVVFNDEAHHCYQEKLFDEDRDQEEMERNQEARVWFKGLQAINGKGGIKTVYDLSATPYYLKGSGYHEGFIFPWVVSDLSLMDAIESGIVKIPRVPVDDDAVGDLVTYLRLWDYVGPHLPKRRQTKKAEPDWVPPPELEGALFSLYRSYERAFDRYEKELAHLGEPPPVMIIVCPNTAVSKLVYDWVSGYERETDAGEFRLVPGNLKLLSNVTDGEWNARPRTILIDSAQLESGEALKPDFKKDASHEIDAFKREYVKRYPGADVETLTDEDLLREVMNTVGKPGKLGGEVRCVVSVSMLTEGWDANTVTHVLGIRRFGSQLLCEQVVGRGLRRRSYAVNDDGLFEPEYAEVYGVPFAFIPSDQPVDAPKPRSPAAEVYAVDERYVLRITFPKLDGYRIELPDDPLHADLEHAPAFKIEPSSVALWTQAQGIVGESAEEELERFRQARTQEVAFAIAKRALEAKLLVGHDGTMLPWRFHELVEITRDWMDQCLHLADGVPVGMLLLTEANHAAAEQVVDAIVRYPQARTPTILPILRRFDPQGATDDVHFMTRKPVIDSERSHVNRVVLDGPKGNTWEEKIACVLEERAEVAAYVKNDHLGFMIPYVHEGRSFHYVPDFLVRLKERDGEEVCSLIIEVSGGRKSAHSPGSVATKGSLRNNSSNAFRRWQWCPSPLHLIYRGNDRSGYDATGPEANNSRSRSGLQISSASRV